MMSTIQNGWLFLVIFGYCSGYVVKQVIQLPVESKFREIQRGISQPVSYSSLSRLHFHHLHPPTGGTKHSKHNKISKRSLSYHVVNTAPTSISTYIIPENDHADTFFHQTSNVQPEHTVTWYEYPQHSTKLHTTQGHRQFTQTYGNQIYPQQTYENKIYPQHTYTYESHLNPQQTSSTYYKYNIEHKGGHHFSYAPNAPVISTFQKSPTVWWKSYSHWKSSPVSYNKPTNVWWTYSSLKPAQHTIYEKPVDVWIEPAQSEHEPITTDFSKTDLESSPIITDISKLNLESSPITADDSKSNFESGPIITENLKLDSDVNKISKPEIQNSDYSSYEYDYSPLFKHGSPLAIPLSAVSDTTAHPIVRTTLNPNERRLLNRGTTKYPTHTEVEFKPYPEDLPPSVKSLSESHGLEPVRTVTKPPIKFQPPLPTEPHGLEPKVKITKPPIKFQPPVP